MTEQKKKIYIEVIRVAAILLVLYCHTSVNGLLYFQMDKGNRSSQLAIFSSFIRHTFDVMLDNICCKK